MTVFSDPEVLQLLRTRFVPVAVDNHHIERQKDAEGDLYRKVAGHQGEYICTIDGKLLGSTNTHDAAHLKRLMEKALQDFEPASAAPAADGKPDATFTRKPPEGGIIVDVTTKVLGGYEPSEDKITRIVRSSLGRDHVWIEKDELQGLLKRKMPDSLKKRIACYHLVDNTRGEPPWWNRNEIRKLEMVLREDGRLTGSVHLETDSGDRGFTADLLGFVKTGGGKVTRFDVVVKGVAWGAGHWNGGEPPGKYPLAFAFTLSDGREEADKVLPQGACRGNFKGYFAP